MSEDGLVKIVVLDDHPIFQYGIFALLSGSRYEVVRFCDRNASNEVINNDAKHVVIMGVSLKVVRAPFFLANTWTEIGPPLVFITNTVTAIPIVQRAAGTRTCGILCDTVGRSELISCLDSVCNGIPYLSPTLRRRDQKRALQKPSFGARLTSRQIEVASMLREGLTSEDIGTRLGIAASTVESHIKAMRRKLGVRSRTQIALSSAVAAISQPTEESPLNDPDETGFIDHQPEHG